MKNVIVVAEWFQDCEIGFGDYLQKHQDKIESVYINGAFYEVDQVLAFLKS